MHNNFHENWTYFFREFWTYLFCLICFVGVIIDAKTKKDIGEPKKLFGLSQSDQVRLSYIGSVVIIILIIWKLLK